MTDTLKAVGLVIAGAVIGLLVSASSGGTFGGVYSNVTKDFSDGITVDGTVVIDGSGNVDAPITSSSGTFSGDVSVSGGTVTLTTANSATSTAIIGCIQSYATSTATAIRMEFSTTTALATYSGGPVPTGVVAWRYGTCPNL